MCDVCRCTSEQKIVLEKKVRALVRLVNIYEHKTKTCDLTTSQFAAAISKHSQKLERELDADILKTEKDIKNSLSEPNSRILPAPTSRTPSSTPLTLKKKTPMTRTPTNFLQLLLRRRVRRRREERKEAAKMLETETLAVR